MSHRPPADDKSLPDTLDGTVPPEPENDTARAVSRMDAATERIGTPTYLYLDSESGEGVFDSPTAGVDSLAQHLSALTSSTSSVIGQSFADYEILEEIGHGGMGVVYKARHTRLNRLVALKMILAGEYANQQEQLRFLSEAKAIARLQHSHIVQVFDLAQHGGRLYFSMEFVPGGTLSMLLAGQPQPAEDAARMIAKIAGGIQAAHDHDIVHRDLKPANILLTEDGEPKITDFGLAKLGDSGLTASQAIMGTPSYMAPEQARGEASDVGPAADVYALGAILYECLTGRPPFKSSTPLETIRQVLDQEAVPPRQLNGNTPRDLEIICLKCLRKDPAKRYDSALALADDLERFLDGQPILAKPVGKVERCRLWTRRNPLVAGLTTLVVLVTIIGMVGMWSQYRTAAFERDRAYRQERLQRIAAGEAQEQRDRAITAQRAADENATTARIRAEQSDRTAQFLEGLFQSSDPTSFLSYGFRTSSRKGREVTAKELLERGAKQIAQELGDQPLVKARMLDTIGRVYRSLGEYEAAQPLLEESLALRERSPQVPPLDLADSLTDVGWLWHDLGDYVRAESMLQRAIAIQRQHPEAFQQLSKSLILLGWVLADQKNPEGERHLLESIRIRETHLPYGHRDIAMAQGTLAAYYFNVGQWKKGLEYALKARTGFAKQEQGAQIERAMSAFQLGVSWYNLGDYQKSEASLIEALEAGRQFLGDEHPLLCLPLAQLGIVKRDAGDLESAEKYYRASLELLRRTISLGHPRAMELVDGIQEVLERRGNLAEIEPIYDEVLAACEKSYGGKHVNRIMPLVMYAEVLCKLNKPAEAAAHAREALRIIPTEGALRNPYAGVYFNELGLQLQQLKQYPEAIELYQAALRHHLVHSPKDDSRWFNSYNLANALLESDQFDACEQQLQATLQIVRENQLSAGYSAATFQLWAHQARDANQPPEVVEELLRRSLADWAQDPFILTPNQDEAFDELIDQLVERGDYAQVEAVLEQACDLLRQRDEPGSETLSWRLSQLAACQLAAGKPEVSPELRQRCRDLLPSIEDPYARWQLVTSCCVVPDAEEANRVLAVLGEDNDTARGVALYRAGKTDEALALFESPQRTLDWLFAAQVQQAAGKPELAKKSFETVTKWLNEPSTSDPRQTNGQQQSWSTRQAVDTVLAETAKQLQ